MFRRRLRYREGFVEISTDLEDAERSFLCLFELLLHCILLGLEREDGSVAVREGVELALGFFRGQVDQFRGHEVADCADVLFVVDTGQDAVEEFGDIDAGESGVQTGVKSFVGALCYG